MTLSGRLRRVATVPGNLKLHDIAADGRVLLSREEWRVTVYYLGPEQSSPRELTWLNWATNPFLSDDGQSLLTTEEGAGTRWYATYLRRTDGSPAVRLGPQMGVSLSPDSKWVVTADPKEGRPQLTLLPVKTGNPVPVPTGPLDLGGIGRPDIPAVTWFPDSQRILFSAKEAGRDVRAFVLDIRGGLARPVTPEGISGTILTSDGATLLVYDSRQKAFLYPLNGRAPKPLEFLTPEYQALRFSADGRALFVLKRNERSARVWRLDLATGHFGIWRDIPFADPAGLMAVRAIRITPDGKSLAYLIYRDLSELYLAEGLK